MENKVKAMIEGVDSQTGEVVKMEFEGDATCVITVKDNDGGVGVEECLVGAVNGESAMALIKGMTSAVNHLLDNLPPILSAAIMAELFCDVMDKKDQAEMAAEAEDRGVENGMD